MKKIFTILFTAAIFLGSCNESKKEVKGKDEVKKDMVKENKETGFTIDAPAGWEKSDTTYKGERVVFIRHPRQNESDIFMENVNVTTEKVDNSMSTEYFFEANRSNMASQLNNFVQGPVSDVTINGNVFKKTEYSHIYSGVTMAGESYLLVKDGTAYVLTCSALKDEIDIYREIFKEITGSFAFSKAN